MPRRLLCLSALVAFLVSSEAQAGKYDLDLTPLGALNDEGNVTHNHAGFRLLASEVGVLMAPKLVDPADKLGLSGFAVDGGSGAATITQILSDLGLLKRWVYLSVRVIDAKPALVPNPTLPGEPPLPPKRQFSYDLDAIDATIFGLMIQSTVDGRASTRQTRVPEFKIFSDISESSAEELNAAMEAIQDLSSLSRYMQPLRDAIKKAKIKECIYAQAYIVMGLGAEPIVLLIGIATDKDGDAKIFFRQSADGLPGLEKITVSVLQSLSAGFP